MLSWAAKTMEDQFAAAVIGKIQNGPVFFGESHDTLGFKL
jgi:hypothetical protein